MEHQQPLKSQADVPVEVPKPLPTIKWKDGCGNELQRAIVNRLNDMIGTAVSRATPRAIFGPNLLEFSLPINYDVERKTLDRPETVARIEAVIEELVGQQIRVRFRTVEAVETAVKPSVSAVASQRTQVVDQPDDPYLQDVSKIFGVESWTVKEVIVEAAEEGAPEMGAE